MLTLALAGLGAGLSLIIAIGAQNAFVLRQGLRREHVGVVVAICAVSDLVLILAGTLGIGAIVERAPWALVALKWLGAAYLAWFGIRSLLSARTPGELHESGAADGRALTSVALTTVALTWLNPHVYLDTVVMLGNLANQHGPTGRWWFSGGAGVGSVLWFSGLGFGARALSGPLGRPRTWQVLDVLIGLMMLGLAVMLVFM